MTVKELETENKRLRKRVAELEEELDRINNINNSVSPEEWGDEYNDEEIEQLQRFFQSYTASIQLSAPQKFRFMDICRLELMRKQTSSEMDAKQSKTISEELKSLYSILNLNVDARADRSSDQMFIDSIIAKIEQTEPASSDQVDYTDTNGFESASREIYRCLRNSVCGQREFPDITADPNDPSEELKLQQ